MTAATVRLPLSGLALSSLKRRSSPRRAIARFRISSVFLPLTSCGPARHRYANPPVRWNPDTRASDFEAYRPISGGFPTIGSLRIACRIVQGIVVSHWAAQDSNL